jgi:geranylgeranyl diphosphate synthase, type II
VVEQDFRLGLSGSKSVEPRLRAALDDVLSRPGSLIRALVTYLVGTELAVTDAAARAMACGVEYLHTASLIFDDLPSMDDARTRRGAVCLHVVHGEATATLAALALINRGYALLWQGMMQGEPARQARAGLLVEDCLGLPGIIGGQAYDLSGWRGQQDVAIVTDIAARKTGALLKLTVLLPALIGGATPRELHCIERLTMMRGLAYQAADDLKDVLAMDHVSGKTGGRDEELGRPNLVAAEGFPASFARFKRLQRIGDRVQALLMAESPRWSMLDLLKVAEPQGMELAELGSVPDAV